MNSVWDFKIVILQKNDFDQVFYYIYIYEIVNYNFYRVAIVSIFVSKWKFENYTLGIA